MPQALGLLLFTIGAPIGVVNAVSIGFGATLVQAGLAVGATYLGSLLQSGPEAPKPSDVKTNIAEPTASRIRHVGIVRTSGVLAFIEPRNGDLYKLIATGTDRLQSILGYYVNDELVTLDGLGQVNEYKDLENAAADRIRILTRLGQVPETAYTELISAFPGIWTADHRGDGVSSSLMIMRQSAAEDFGKIFPAGTNTGLSLVVETRFYDPRVNAVAPSENAALIIRDYLTSQWGMRLDPAWVNNANDSWITAADVCGEDVPLKGGGSENRWRLGMSYSMAERPADVLQRMLEACDGMIYPTPDMGLALKVGRWEEPSVTIGASAVVAFSGLTRGGDVLSRANTVRARYTSRDHDFSEQDAEPWIVDNDLSDDGENAVDLELFASPSHSQTRRLQKLQHWRLNPRWRGTLVCNLQGLAVLGKRFIRVDLTEYGLLFEAFEVQGQPSFVMDGNVVKGIQIEIVSMEATAYTWNPALEEGTAPAVPVDIEQEESALPIPSGFNLVRADRTVAGNTLSFAVFSAAAPADPNHSIAFEVSSNDGGTWAEVGHDRKIHSAEFGPLSDNITYLGRARTKTLTGRLGTPTGSLPIFALYGSPELVVNGAFAADTNWAKTGGWTISTGAARHAAGAEGVLSQGLTLFAGQQYSITYTVLDYVAGGVTPRLYGATLIDGVTRFAAGTYTDVVTAVTGQIGIEFTADSSANLAIDDVSVTRVA
ncbi:MAG: hypothetical protein V7704_20600 [Aurantimonas endophytica]|uniref:hypothetical protein n=1 Tax=Aurantimonas endophytica TaxID=1522175 RepID=UPI0030029E14